MASAGPNYPGTVADNAAVGTVAWTTTGTIGTLSDHNGPGTGDLGTGGSPVENSIRLIQGGSIAGDNKSTGAAIGVSVGAANTISYGGASDLWGLTLAAGDINAGNFGVALSIKATNTSHYLSLTGFGFSIPAGATITGIQVSVQWFYSGTLLHRNGSVDACSITVYYTPAPGGG